VIAGLATPSREIVRSQKFVCSFGRSAAYGAFLAETKAKPNPAAAIELPMSVCQSVRDVGKTRMFPRFSPFAMVPWVEPGSIAANGLPMRFSVCSGINHFGAKRCSCVDKKELAE
jgi:hypothetical protein